MNRPIQRRRPVGLRWGTVVAGSLALFVIVVIWRLGSPGGGSASGGLPPWSFQVSTVKTSLIGNKASGPGAEAHVPEIEAVMRSYYDAAFVDPDNWKRGTYEPAWSLFDPAIVARARASVDELTLGSAAGERYQEVLPQTSLLGVRILEDARGEARTAFALVTFWADARTSDGRDVAISSQARFALAPTEAGWEITGFRARTEEVPLGSPAPTGGVILGRAEVAEAFPAYAGKPVTILVIGDSYRSGETHLADSIHLVTVDPGSGEGTVVGFPRDSWVPIPGHGERKINEAFSLGGTDLMIGTIEDLTGVTVDYYAVTTFGDFVALVKAIGGVDIRIPYAINDPGSGAKLGKGPTTLGGKDALRFARSRYDVPNGDFSRQHNEGLILLAMLEQFGRSSRQEPSVLVDWLAAAINNVETDLSMGELAELGGLAAQLDAERFTNIVVPGVIDTEGDQSIVRLEPEARDLFEDLRDNGVLDRDHQGASV